MTGIDGTWRARLLSAIRRALVLAALMCGFLLAAALLAATARASTAPAGVVGDLVAAVAGKD